MIILFFYRTRSVLVVLHEQTIFLHQLNTGLIWTFFFLNNCYSIYKTIRSYLTVLPVTLCYVLCMSLPLEQSGAGSRAQIEGICVDLSFYTNLCFLCYNKAQISYPIRKAVKENGCGNRQGVFLIVVTQAFKR